MAQAPTQAIDKGTDETGCDVADCRSNRIAQPAPMESLGVLSAAQVSPKSAELRYLFCVGIPYEHRMDVNIPGARREVPMDVDCVHTGSE